jgi:hypothetical protein
VPDSQRCPACKQWKPVSEFPRNRSTRDGFAAYCKPCHNERGRRNRQRLHGSTRHYHLKRRYGIGARDVERMIEAQGGMCAVCRTAPAQHVDHDHATGQVRGILCFNCNGGLGQFRDDRAVLERAITYLRHHADEDDGLGVLARARVGALTGC